MHNVRRVTVLGSSCSIPRPSRACSSYLVEAGGATFVIDLGSGAFSNLVRYQPPEMLDAIVITHMHADHFLDLVPLRYALKYGPRTNARTIPLYLPPAGEAMLRRLCSAFAKEPGDDFLTDIYDVRVYDPAAVLRLGDATLRFAPTEHFIPTFGVRCDSGGASFAYSSDTAPVRSVATLARTVDLFICEATLTDAEASEPKRGHMTAREAGRLAALAAVKKLVLTHYPATANPLEIATHAREGFDGTIDVADDGDRLEF